MTIGYLCLLSSMVLCECVVFLDEVKKMKKGLCIAWCVLSLLAGKGRTNLVRPIG